MLHENNVNCIKVTKTKQKQNQNEKHLKDFD